MIAAYRELDARLDELEGSVTFTATSASLRPRLGGVLRWSDGGEAIGLARDFISAKARPETIYSALLVRTVAAFEHFARVLVEDVARRTAATGKTYAELGDHVRTRHAVLTGRLLGGLEEPLDYQVLDVKQLAENLASCVSGSSSFRLNTSAFAAVVTNPRPGVIEKALANLDFDGWWDAVGTATDLQTLLGTRGARDTSKAANKYLEELCKRRNRIAHAGDGDVTVSESDLREGIFFVRALAEAISRVVEARLK
jgi:hypothetical protein